MTVGAVHERLYQGGSVQDAHHRLPRRLAALVEQRDHLTQQRGTSAARAGGDLQVGDRAVAEPQSGVAHDDQVEHPQVAGRGDQSLGRRGHP